MGESRVWMSVTPVVLHGRDHKAGKFRARKVEKLLFQAFHEGGYHPRLIEELSYQQAPYWRGAGPARLAQMPRHLSHWPRYHVRIVLRQAVRGPLLAGIGRHYGLGVFATP